MFPFVPSKPLWSCFIPREREERVALGPKDAASSLRRISSTQDVHHVLRGENRCEEGQENDARNSRCHTPLQFLPSGPCDGAALILLLVQSSSKSLGLSTLVTRLF